MFKKLHHYMLNLDAKRHNITDMMKFDAISLPLLSFYIGNAYYQYAGVEYLGHPISHYHVYLCLHDVLLLDPILFPNPSSRKTVNAEKRNEPTSVTPHPVIKARILACLNIQRENWLLHRSLAHQPLCKHLVIVVSLFCIQLEFENSVQMFHNHENSQP